MKRNILHVGAVFLMALFNFSSNAQIGGDGYYRARNADNNGTEYISIANDFFNFSTVISNGAGASYVTGRGLPYAINSTKMFLRNDIHLINNQSQIISPAEVIYFDKKNSNASNHDYNLIAQGTSLLTLTTGLHIAGKGTFLETKVYFRDVYANITSTDGTNTANTQYIASVPLKGYYSTTGTGVYANLGSYYLVDSAGVFNINASSSNLNAKWYIQPITYFNVQPDLEFHGKYYTTLFVPFSCTLGENINKAYVIHEVSSGSLVYEAIASSGDSIPAGTPVILECNSSSAADCKLFLNNAKKPIFTAPDVTKQSGSPRADETTSYYSGTNLLKGTYYCNTDGTITYTYLKRTSTSSGGYTFSEAQTSLNGNHYTTYNKTVPATVAVQKYILGINANGNLGFVQATATNPAPSGIFPANTAWMTVAGEFAVAKPTFDPTAGTKNNPLYVTINCATPGATIYYTTDGSDPTTSETKQEYTGPVFVEKTTTIKAYAVLGDGNGEGLFNNTSAVASANYTLKVATPTFNPPAGNYSSPQSVTISCATQGATIYYTLDGTTPSNKKILYTGPITVDHDVTIKAIAYHSPMTASAVGTAAYKFPKITADPSELTISDDDQNNTFIVTGNNLNTDNVGVTTTNDFKPFLTATTGSATNDAASWYYTPTDGSLSGAVAVTYEGRELMTTGTINIANNQTSTSVNVTYKPDLYLIGNYGGSGWNYANGTNMSEADGIYTTTITIPANGDSYIMFARKTGETYDWNDQGNGGNRYFFGASTDGGDWVYTGAFDGGNLELTPTHNNKYCPIKFPQDQAGTYTITVNANNNTFTITKVMTLADIVNDGEVGCTYVISDDILGVYIAEKESNKVYAKDLGLYRNPVVATGEQIDYVKDVAHLQSGDWDQSNWVMLEFDSNVEASQFANGIINGGTLSGVLTDKQNPTMQVTGYQIPEQMTSYATNNYVTANFMDTQVQHSSVSDKDYFFIQPKPQEYVYINWAMYDGGTHFSAPNNQDNSNEAALLGSFNVDWSLYPGNPETDFEAGLTYNFHAIVRYTSRNRDGASEGGYAVYPCQNDATVTAIVENWNDMWPVEVMYVNAMGQTSDKPFDGLNIIVTRYSNGTITTTKVIK